MERRDVPDSDALKARDELLALQRVEQNLTRLSEGEQNGK